MDPGGDSDEVGIFPAIEDGWLDSAAFHLLYQRHGGAGVALTLTEIEDMPVARILWWVERLDQTLEAEAKALKGSK